MTVSYNVLEILRDIGSGVKIKGVLQGGGAWRAIAISEPGKCFSFDTPNSSLNQDFNPNLGKHTETFKITNKIAFIMISKSAKSLQTH